MKMPKDHKPTPEDIEFSKPFISFIHVLFVVIIGSGFKSFSANFNIDDVFNNPSSANLFFLLYFITGYFVVVTDFVTYHVIIEKYPYPNGGIYRFFEDVFIFFLLYILLSIVSIWPTPRNLWVFLCVLSLWHIFLMGWHFHVKCQYDLSYHPLPKGIKDHAFRAIIYIMIFASYTFTQSGIPASIPNESHIKDITFETKTWILIVSVFIVSLSIQRLNSIFKWKINLGP